MVLERCERSLSLAVERPLRGSIRRRPGLKAVSFSQRPPPCGMQSRGFGLPRVERSRDGNGGGWRMSGFKANGHALEGRCRG